MFQFSQFVWPLSYSVWDVFNNFLLIDATDRSKISINQKRFFIALSLYPLSFFANTPFKFFKILKIHEIFCENPRIIFVLFYDVHKENMFTINLEDGREAPSKTSIQIFRYSEMLKKRNNMAAGKIRRNKNQLLQARQCTADLITMT